MSNAKVLKAVRNAKSYRDPALRIQSAGEHIESIEGHLKTLKDCVHAFDLQPPEDPAPIAQVIFWKQTLKDESDPASLDPALQAAIVEVVLDAIRDMERCCTGVNKTLNILQEDLL